MDNKRDSVIYYIQCLFVRRFITNKQYPINKLISNSFVIVGKPNENLGYALACNSTMSNNNMSKLAMTGNNGTNGFSILDWWQIDSLTRGGDWDNDGYEEAIFGMPSLSNYRGIVTITPGGASPAWSPYIFEPMLIMECESNTFVSEVLTNVVIGRKGKRHSVLSDNSEYIQQDWLGTWFTTKVIRTAINETATINFWTTNILGSSAPSTKLVISDIPEISIIGYQLSVICILLLRKKKN